MTKSKQRSILRKIQKAITPRHPELVTGDLGMVTLGEEEALALEVQNSYNNPEFLLFYITADGRIHIDNTCEHPINGAEGIHVALRNAQVITLGKVADLASLIIETCSH